MSDPYNSLQRSPDQGFTNIEAVTPSDEADLPNAGFIFVHTAGDIKVTPLDAPAGHEGIVLPDWSGLLPVRVRKVYATDTLATNIQVWW